ncbi:DUF4192 domain-containing protein [Sciscionella sediminilitoris]|uniref:DUF4192 domain-containing protein n=1 Tax=Sciscionella sediminilitoris TaxID=1445613 RepID=UPI00068CBBC0|nr:DUF4192 domain-containing protein [Sciscionella sp. SE31]
MTATRHSVLRLEEPGSVIAAVPLLLGFNPSDSLVLLLHRGPERDELGLVLRADLPDTGSVSVTAEHLLEPAQLQGGTAATVVLVGGRLCWEHLRAVAVSIRDRFRHAGIPVLHMLWTSHITAGQPWRCLDEDDCHGLVEDPEAGTLVALSPSGGGEAGISRSDLEQRLARAPDEVLARRAAVLARGPDDRQRRPEQWYALVRDAANADTGTEPDDRRLAELAQALRITDVRDAFLVGRTDREQHAFHALWTMLTRALPDPAGAPAGCLLAVSAYLAGDGVLAGMALERVHAAEPGYQLANLLSTALRAGVQPSALTRRLSPLAQAARARLGVC